MIKFYLFEVAAERSKNNGGEPPLLHMRLVSTLGGAQQWWGVVERGEEEGRARASRAERRASNGEREKDVEKKENRELPRFNVLTRTNERFGTSG